MRLLLIMVLNFGILNAGSLDDYHRRFNFKRNDQGELTSVKLKVFTQGFSLRPYLNQVKADLKFQIESMRSQSFVGANTELDEFERILSEDFNSDPNQFYVTGREKSEPRIAREAIEKLGQIDVDHMFKEVEKKGVLKKFEQELKKALRMLDITIIAAPNDAKFFYRKKVTYTVVKNALDFAKNRFSNVPVLNMASYLIVKINELVLEQRTFNHYALLHYLNNFSEAELGLSPQELDLIRSSIYESRIAPINFRESKAAAANWERYGTDKFFAEFRIGTSRLRQVPFRSSERINFAFANSEVNGKRVILNLLAKKHMFSSKQAIAFYYDKPNKVRQIRGLIQLSELGLGFLPIPGWIKSNVQGFLGSFYEQQKMLEGSLIAYFQSNGDQVMLEKIFAQNLNPYIKL